MESLDGLKSAFSKWRRSKKHIREGIPDELIARAQRCVTTYGLASVARATGVDSSRLQQRKAAGPKVFAASKRRPQSGGEAAPEFSRLELGAATLRSDPVVELETLSGVKLRLFAQTPEMLSLVAALCGVGGAR